MPLIINTQLLVRFNVGEGTPDADKLKQELAMDDQTGLKQLNPKQGPGIWVRVLLGIKQKAAAGGEGIEGIHERADLRPEGY